MAIQFQCPGCNQPIEIDDAWASKQVACPYCRVTVTAPAASTLDPPAAPPVAKPLTTAPAWSVEAAPGESVAPTRPAKGNPYAPMSLALICIALAIYLAINIAVSMKVQDSIGPSPTPEEMRQAVVNLQKEWMEQLETGQLPGFLTGLMLGLLGMFATWTAGLVLAVIALQRRSRRGMTIAALILAGIVPVLMCLGFAIGL